MPFYRKRGNTWRAEVERQGIRRSKSFPSKSAAVAWASQAEAAIMGGDRSQLPRMTFGDLLKRYRDEVSVHKKGARWEAIRIALLLKDDKLAKVSVRDLDAAHVAAWRDRRLAQVSAASVRREWNLLSNACTIAIREWRILRANPFAGVRRPKGGKSRDRLATPEEMERLAKAADTPAKRRVLGAFRFGVETGMRAGEICSLKAISGVVARLEDTKNGTRRRVPLSAAALALWAEFGPFDLSPGTLDVGWRKLTKAAGVENLHFHDSRHMAITALSGKLNLFQLARMVGIKNLQTLNVYYNESAEDIAKRL